MIDWNDRFNALPKDVRVIGSAMEAQTRIQQLNFEKDRLRVRYKQSMKECNDHIRNCEKWLADLEKRSETTLKGERE